MRGSSATPDVGYRIDLREGKALYEQYRQVNRDLPLIGEEVSTPQGRARVIVGHPIKETVSVRYADDRVPEWPPAEVHRPLPAAN